MDIVKRGLRNNMNALKEEYRIIDLLRQSKTVIYNNKEYQIILADKPTYFKGEGKTDIYLVLKNTDEEVVLKISTKKSNADFLENKVKASRAKEIFGENWSEIITISALQLKDKFYKRQLYYPKKTGRIKAGSYTMGWRLDIINKCSGELVCPIILSPRQKEEVFLGTNLSIEKRNVQVGKNLITNAGVANRILLASEKYNTAQEILDALIKIEDYRPDCFLAFKAVNYRSLEDEIDGNRPLAVWVDWETPEPSIIFDSPLVFGAEKDILEKFKKVFK